MQHFVSCALTTSSGNTGVMLCIYILGTAFLCCSETSKKSLSLYRLYHDVHYITFLTLSFYQLYRTYLLNCPIYYCLVSERSLLYKCSLDYKFHYIKSSTVSKFWCRNYLVEGVGSVVLQIRSIIRQTWILKCEHNRLK